MQQQRSVPLKQQPEAPTPKPRELVPSAPQKCVPAEPKIPVVQQKKPERTIPEEPKEYKKTTQSSVPVVKQKTPEPQRTAEVPKKQIPDPQRSDEIPQKQIPDIKRAQRKVPEQNVKLNTKPGDVSVPRPNYDYKETFEVIFKTADVFRAGTDGVFYFYLAEIDHNGHITGEPMGPYPIKSEGELLEQNTTHYQTFKTGKFQHSALLTGLAGAVIIHKTTSSWYDQISDGWKPEFITVHFKKNATDVRKTFTFPKGEKEGWIEKNGFYIIKANGEGFKYVEGSAKKHIQDIIGL